MSGGIWAAIAGGAKKYTQDKELEQASEMEMRRWQEKQNFLNKLTMEAEERQQEYKIQEEGRKRADNLLSEEARLLEKRADQERDDARFKTKIEMQRERDKATDQYRNRSLNLQGAALAAQGTGGMRDSDLRGYEEGASKAAEEIVATLNPVDKDGSPMPVEGAWKSELEKATDEALRIPDPRRRYEELQFIRRVAKLGPRG